MQLLIIREGVCTELALDARQNGIATYAQLQAFLAKLTGDTRKLRFISDAGEVTDYSTKVCSERIICLYADTNASPAGAISINRMKDFYYKCALAPRVSSPEPRLYKPFEVVKSLEVPISDKTLPRKQAICKGFKGTGNVQSTGQSKPAFMRKPHLSRGEEALLLSSESELQQTVAAVRGVEAGPVLKEDGRVDLAALESAKLEQIKGVLEGQQICYRAIVEEEGCPVISAERKGVVESIASKDVIRVKEEGSLNTNSMRFDTLYSLSLAHPSIQAVPGCSSPTAPIRRSARRFRSWPMRCITNPSAGPSVPTPKRRWKKPAPRRSGTASCSPPPR